ncbi:magnesium transporter [Dethiobacter alkaliphilus]|uniref:magnesium transporter n=1 Tax=Dethiobacter alkaliphilus TaxID=427926 RepID=UPI002225F407|nr:magnesium transporter [Dethiobacter alkaliphilus]MCW3489427.1 magnesium transporter [Dethiobacter alkaliphilus]
MAIYEAVQNLLAKKKMEDLKNLLNEVDFSEIVEMFPELTPEEQVIVFRLLTKDQALDVFEQLDVWLQEKLLSSFAEERSIELFEQMDADDRVRLLDELPAKVARKLLAALSPEQRKLTAVLQGYAPETAGRIMNPEYVSLKGHLTVAQALERIRQQGEKDTLYMIYITDENRKLKGSVSLQTMVLADPEEKLENIMDKVASVQTGTDQEEAAHLLQERDLLALPVVDREDRLVGVITVDDAIDIIQDEATEDILDKAGLTSFGHQESARSYRLVGGSVWGIWRVRLPFLLITLIGGLMAGAVIGTFEETLEAMAAVAFFIPLIMDMGGNLGTQSSSIFTRAYVLGHINMKAFSKHLAKEVGVGLSIGVMLGILAAIAATVWQGSPELGIAVGLALAATCTLASGLGFFIPWVLVRLGMDQVAGSDPIITTIKDITGLLIYFFLINQFVGLI